MKTHFLNRKVRQLGDWWRRPPSRLDRVWSALIGLWAGFWIGGLGRIIYETPVSFTEVAKFALAGGIVAATIGVLFPKASRIVFFPFACLGFGGGGT